MIQLIYRSKEREDFSPSDLKMLLARARVRNSAVDATGMLIYHGGMFLQALEGEEAVVNKIFRRIENDPRHGDLCVLHRNPSVRGPRIFGEWSMGFVDSTGAAHLLKGFTKMEKGINLSTLDKTNAMKVLVAGSRASFRQSA
jgi:Sensors of blue-light using FAD